MGRATHRMERVKDRTQERCEGNCSFSQIPGRGTMKAVVHAQASLLVRTFHVERCFSSFIRKAITYSQCKRFTQNVLGIPRY